MGLQSCGDRPRHIFVVPVCFRIIAARAYYVAVLPEITQTEGMSLLLAILQRFSEDGIQRRKRKNC